MASSNRADDHILRFAFEGDPLEAHRLTSGSTPHFSLYEVWKVHPPGEPGEPIDQIEVFYDKNSEEWTHWPTKFGATHRPLGKILAKERTENPEVMRFMIKVDLHRHVDLSDRPTTKFLPSEGTGPDDAVFRLREKIDEERKEDARREGLSEGTAVLILRSGSKRYVGNVHRTGWRKA